MGRTVEVSTVGIDEALQGFSTDPFGSSYPSTIGLRVPAFVPAKQTPPEPSSRYLFLLASRQVGERQRVRLRGWRQYLTIGMSSPANINVPSRPVELEVTTPSFRFPDGNVSWHLVREPPTHPVNQRPNTDLANFMFVDSDGPALLYQTAAFSAATGFYMLNLTTYTPPLERQGTWEPIAGLGNVHDLRALWRDDHAWDSLDVCVEGQCRISLYASVLQTNPATRARPTLPAGLTAPPEEVFMAAMQTVAGEEDGVRYWRVAGALIFDDCEPECEPDEPGREPNLPECGRCSRSMTHTVLGADGAMHNHACTALQAGHGVLR